MAETATKTTNPRSRARTTKAAPAAASKPAATKVAPAKAAPEPVEDGNTRVAFTLDSPFAETKTYTKFDLSVDKEGNATGCVGTIYAPLGTEEVAIRLTGPADAITGE